MGSSRSWCIYVIYKPKKYIKFNKKKFNNPIVRFIGRNHLELLFYLEIVGV